MEESIRPRARIWEGDASPQGRRAGARPAAMSLPGFRLYSGFLGLEAQRTLVATVMERVIEAPFYRPVTPSGAPMSVEMTNFGPLGWMTDATGYRYQALHPTTGDPWPPIPIALLEMWRDVTGGAAAPDACLVNLYCAGARMGRYPRRRIPATAHARLSRGASA